MLEQGNHDDLSSLDIVSMEEGCRIFVFELFQIVAFRIVASIVKHIRIIASDDGSRTMPLSNAKVG